MTHEQLNKAKFVNDIIITLKVRSRDSEHTTQRYAGSMQHQSEVANQPEGEEYAKILDEMEKKLQKTFAEYVGRFELIFEEI